MSDVLATRITVAYLGENAQFNWWQTSLFGTTAKTFLDPIFPKTMLLAQYRGAVEAACLQHDEHLSTGSYHLFRLPEEIEAELDEAVRSADSQHFFPQDRTESLDRLKLMSGNTIPASVGPVALGNIADLFDPEVIRSIAATYFAAFSSGNRAYPYFVR